MDPEHGGKLSLEALVERVRAILRSICEREDAGTPPYLSDLSESLSGSFPFDPAELLQFLERYGYLVVDRANSLVGVSRDGRRVAAGDKTEDLTGDLGHQYEGRAPAGQKRPPRVHELLDGRYRRFGVIGSGAVATVYRGEAIAIRREVAIKELREIFAYFTVAQRAEIVRRLERIVAEQARISHPNVLQVLDQSVEREFPYVVAELSHGGSLRRLVARDQPVPPALVLSFFIQVCHGLKMAHALGVVHRGLKPENVLLDVNGNAKLSDFGMTGIVDRGPSRTGHVFVGMGSVGYMAPEQFHDPRQADARTDIYALGILFYELCTGRLPGRRSPMPSEVRQDLPKGLDEVFDRMTQDDPDERYPLVEAILDDVYRVEGVLGLLDDRGAILMHRGPFAELDLSPLDFEALEALRPPDPAEATSAIAAVSTAASSPSYEAVVAHSGSYDGSGANHVAQPGTAPARSPDGGGLPAEPALDLGGAPAGPALDELMDLDVSDDQLLDYEPVEGEGGERDGRGPRPSYPPQPSSDRTPEPVMPRRRFGVPPRRK